MKAFLTVLITIVIISGCTATKVENKYSSLALTDNAIQSPKWQNLDRFSARYPKQAVIKAIEGCATIEYVITPENEIKDITVIASTNKHFAKAAAAVINKWHWSALPKSIISEAVKTQTRFDFCFDQPNQPCSTITPKYSCPSDDIIYSTGMRIRQK